MKNIFKKSFILFSLFFSVICCAQKNYTCDNDANNQAIFNNCIQSLKVQPTQNIDSSFLQVGLHFLNSPYTSYTLENNNTENLIVNLSEFDCMTFIESCLAIALTTQSDSINYQTFKNQLQKIRYRNGIIDEYTSRLHYTSDWIFNNQKMGILTNITSSIEGIPLSLNIDFMTTHAELYPQLTKEPCNVKKMKCIENEINNRNYYFIPKENIRDIEYLLQNGDIVCFVTSVKGLDISHLGIVYINNEISSFIHASSSAKKVIINPESISDYCKKIKSNNGIIVLRLNNSQ